MSAIISFGKFNHYYKYILLSTLCLFLNYMTFGINYNYSFVEIKLFPDKGQLYFSKHKYIHFIFCYFFTFILGMIYNITDEYETQRISIISNKTQDKSTESHSPIKFIQKDIGVIYISSMSFFNLLFILFLWVIMDFFMDFYIDTLKDLDFWFFELLMVSYFSTKTFNFKLHSHQKLAIYFNSTLCLTKITAIILSFCDDKSDEYLWYTKDAFFKVLFGIMIYFVLILIRSYVNTKIKAYMDLNIVSAKKLLMLYGLFGTIIYTIICFITTSVECASPSIFSKSNSTSNYLCKVPFNNTIKVDDIENNLTENGALYLDNFSIYFKTFKYSSYIEITKEIIIILLAGITYFYYKYFCLMIIKFLSSIHYIFSNEVYSLFKNLIALPIYTLINEGSFFIEKPINFIIPKYILDTSGDFLFLIGFLVFLELIELNFCDFNKDLRRKIMDRSEYESIGLLEDNFDDDDDNKKEEKYNIGKK